MRFFSVKMYILTILASASTLLCSSDLDRTIGLYVGGAMGDAIGAAQEDVGQAINKNRIVDGMEGGGIWHVHAGLPVGAWTDDTIMAKGMAQSIIEKGTLQVEDVAKRWLRWYHHGELSPTGQCFDIGNATRKALLKFERTGQLIADAGYPSNGSIMRLGPSVMAARDQDEAEDWAVQQGQITHSHKTAKEATRLMAHILGNMIHKDAKTKEDALDTSSFSSDDLIIQAIARSEGEWDWISKSLDELGYQHHRNGHMGSAAETLETALGVFHKTDDFRSG